jgi:hypothetical protein
MNNTTCLIPVSVGELFDKVSILQIKYNRLKILSDIEKVKTEIDFLYPKYYSFLNDQSISIKLNELSNRLKKVNETLWNIEDKIREKEHKKEFDDEFIQLARSVYITNDERAIIKKEINYLCNSTIIEIKSYQHY